MAKTEDDHAYDIPKLNVWFAVGSVLLSLGVVWLVLDDYTRDWKGYQRQFNRLEYERTRQELEASLSEEQRQKLEALASELGEADARLREQAAAIEEIRTQLREIDAVLYRVDQEHRFAKSIYDSERYEFEELAAEHRRASEHQAPVGAEDPKVAAARARLAQIELDLAAKHETVLEATRQRDDTAGRLKHTTEARTRIEKQITALRADQARLERRLAAVEPSFFNEYFRNLPVLDMLNPSIRVQQVVLDKMSLDINFTKIPRVDRCTTCHVAVDRKGYEDLPQPFTTHPKLELYLGGNSPHPLETFGCTVCHLGRDRGTSFAGAAHTPRSDEQRAEWVKKHGWHAMKHWETPMLPGERVQSSCYKCHAQQTEVREAPALRRGITLVEELGCHGCHKIQGFEGRRKAGPDLARAASKLDRDWTWRWIRDPKVFRASTKMPRFFGLGNNDNPEDLARTDVEIHSIVEYLWHHQSSFTPLRGPARGDARRGREIVESVGCVGCHNLPGATAPAATPDNWQRRAFGPELSGLGSKTTYTWLYSWVKNPKHYWAGTRMPSLRLSDQEAADVASYLTTLRAPEFDARPVPKVDDAKLEELVLDYLSLRQPQELARSELAGMDRSRRLLYLGQKMIQRYGCFGCHNVIGYENALGIGTELTEWGSKAVHRLDFGFADIEHTRSAWLQQKLRAPRSFDEGKIKNPDEKLKMPDFGLDDGQVHDLVTAVLGFTNERLPLESVRRLDAREQAVEAGRRLLKDNNCKGCHTLDGEGGDVVEWIAQRGGRTVEEARAFSAPNLTGEGKKVQPEWFFSFLNEPQPVRPWLSMRMPSFGLDDAAATTIVSHFAAADREPFPFETRDERRLTAAELAVARRLASPDYLNCFTCHQQGARKPEGPPEGWAPDLALAHRRLKHDWVGEWLLDPQKLMPGTRMPTYFADEQSGPDDVLGGDEKKQIELLSDYIMSLGRPAAGSAGAGGR